MRCLSVVDLAQVGPFDHHLVELEPVSGVLVSLPLQELIRAVEFLDFLCPLEVLALYRLELVDHLHNVSGQVLEVDLL